MYEGVRRRERERERKVLKVENGCNLKAGRFCGGSFVINIRDF